MAALITCIVSASSLPTESCLILLVTCRRRRRVADLERRAKRLPRERKTLFETFCTLQTLLVPGLSGIVFEQMTCGVQRNARGSRETLEG